MKKIKILAYYLPQFHPTYINDKYWGKGFTEWTNVAKAKPLFRGHEQPMIPSDLGFYDLRVPEIRREQAKMAEEYGIYGFCYFHYWFGGGERILEMPFNEVLKDKSIELPFCLAWANHSWSNKTWNKNNLYQKDITFLEQKYLGDSDYILHFETLLPAFKDDRYIKVDNKPIFMIYLPFDFPECQHFIELWNNLAKQNGFDGIYFIAHYFSAQNLKLKQIKNINKLIEEDYRKLLNLGFDAIAPTHQHYAEVKAIGVVKKAIYSISKKYLRSAIINKYKYSKVMKHFYPSVDCRYNVFPELLPRRDRSPRTGRMAQIYYQSSPLEFEKAMRKCLENSSNENKEGFIFLNSWNEWGEGSFVEPDSRYGKSYLETIKKVGEDNYEKRNQ